MNNDGLELRILDSSHIEDIYDILFPRYFEESHYPKNGFTFSPEKTFETVSMWTSGVEGLLVYGVFDEDVLVSVAVFDIDHTYFNQKECEMVMFYVVPAYRGTPAGRMMRDFVIKYGYQNGVNAWYVYFGSGLGNRARTLWENMWRKVGFTGPAEAMMKIA